MKKYTQNNAFKISIAIPFVFHLSVGPEILHDNKNDLLQKISKYVECISVKVKVKEKKEGKLT